MLKIVLIVAVVLVVAVLIYAATRPDTFRLQRSASVNAPPEKVFALIHDLRSFNSWNPFNKKDPNIKGTYSGPSSGKGSAYAFDGNKEVGQGSIEITESSPPSKIMMNLNMIKPFEAHNIVEFTLQRAGDATNVTWAIQGPLPYIAKVFHLFCNMDRMVGKDFETGLADLKRIAER